MKRRKIKFNSHEEWLNLRKQFIGASEVSILTGNNTYQTAVDLYNRKVNNVETPVNERMRWGNILEDAIAREWANRNARKIRKSNFLYIYGDFLAATIDRLDDMGRIVEIKNMSSFAFNNSKLIKGVPAMYYDQMQAQMLCVNAEQGVFVALINNGELYDMNVEFDYDYAANILLKVEDFVKNHWLKNIPPELPSVEKPQELIEEFVEGTEEDLKIFERIKTLEAAIKQLTEEKSALVDSVKQKLGSNKELVYAGRKLFYYNQYYQFNSQLFKKENPELYETYKNQLVIKFNIGRE